MAAGSSLFDAGADPVMSVATDWLTSTLLGSGAISLCVIAVAFVGLMLMAGRLAIRDGMRVVLGCFVLLGAPLIVAGLRGVADEAAASFAAPQSPPINVNAPPPEPLQPSNYDPYAGASLRRD